MPSFSLASIGRALQRAVEKIPVLRPGGYVTLPTPGYLQASLTGISQLISPFTPSMTITPKGEVIKGAQAEPGQAPAAPAVGYRPSAEASGMSTEALLREIYKPTTTKTTETTKITTPTPLPKAEITTAKPAPAPTPTPPPPTPPPVAGGGGAPTPPATAPGFTAPTLSSLPPAPVQISERAFTGIPAPSPAIPVGQFEAMVRALQELTGGRYIPRPLTGTEPFGPTGALERALRRLRERELGIPAT
jgi:hypothetical protein